MALAHSQVYSFYHWERAYDGNADGITDSISRNWWYEMKEAFKAGGWTVMGSYKGSGSTYNDGDRDLVDGLGAGAGTDDWTVPVFADSTLRPWIVLQCPPIMGVMQIMLGFAQPVNNNPEYWDVRTSPSGSFMAINGGTDGTTSARPTAPDQVTHYSSTTNGVDSQGDYTLAIHACWSADKSQFYFLTHQEACFCQFMAFSVLDNAPANLQDGLVWSVLGNGSPDIVPTDSRMTNGNHYTSATWRGVVDGTVRSMYLGGRGWNNTGIQSQIRIPTNRKTVVGPCELYATTVTARGYYGTIPDIYWNPNSQFSQGFGDTVAGPIKWISGGSLIVPWDSAEPLPRVR